MDDSSSKDEKEESTSSPVDLSALSDFSFGTEWSKVDKSKGPAGGGGQREFRKPRGDRPDRRPGGAGGARKDRRPKKPSFGGGEQGNAGGRRDSGQGGGRPHGDRRPRGDFQGGGRRPMPDRPYESPSFEVGFYPDDTAFSTIIKAMRSNHLTYELFDVAKTFLVKYDRFITSITRRGGDKSDKVFISVPDSMPFETEDAALLHSVTNYPESFYEVEEVETEAPAGNFQFVNRCPFTKVLLGPPNYHKYEENLRHHHRTNLPNMSFDKLQSSVETVREEEVINEWLESQKKVTRYTTKPAEGEKALTIDSMEAAIGYVRANLKSNAVKAVSYARVTGKALEKFPNTEASRAAAGELERQRKFPLETANAIRGRMRREKFSIYKKGAKGVTYVCATKRNFRTPGQVMSDSLDNIIHFLEENQLTKTKEFIAKFKEWIQAKDSEATVNEKQIFQDLHWLIADGYVTHFSDDALYVQPILDNAPKPKSEKAPKAAKAASEAKTPTADKSKAEEAKPDEAKVEGGDAKVEATDAEESKAEEVTVAESKVEEAEAEETKAEETKAEENPVEETSALENESAPAGEDAKAEPAAETPEKTPAEPVAGETSEAEAKVEETSPVEESKTEEASPVEEAKVEEALTEESTSEAETEAPVAEETEADAETEEKSAEPKADESKTEKKDDESENPEKAKA